ncbi:acetylserotonin O-methyltransferase-like isoform X2 [Protopterus annectens]|uniref:acetylserotonin O-methyltransferase-like isoform X2 n=1 Tax=Protopterus annectens TaxID=7888 RepID=UPI001CFC023C|nr:acetylserotonin O-methyltransferase-like isoform X2 [Protopterus annectens]
MSASDDTDYVNKIIYYMQGFLVTKAMSSASKLGVFDILLNSNTPLSCADIAEQAGCTVDGMNRLLTACVELELLNATQENGKYLYSNTHLSRMCIAKSSPKSLYHIIQLMSDHNYLLSFYMADSIRSEEDTLRFIESMDDIWKVCGKDVTTTFDLSHFNTICDIGGCSGAVAKLFISEYPNSRVTIFDLPEVLKITKTHFVFPAEKRISFHEGDFFKDPLPEADLYVLARVIHDWNDEQCLVLLKNIYKSCKPGGAVLIIEEVLNEDKSGPIQSLLWSLLMHIVCNGKERTLSEYDKLLTTAGFQNTDMRTGSLYNAILARKIKENSMLKQ